MKSKQWLNSARFASWWLDLSDLGWPNPELTAKWRHRAGTFQKQGVNAVVMSGFHFRWDFYAVFDRVLGALREISEICHEHELRVVERHSATRIHRARSDEDRHEIFRRHHHHVPFYPDDWEGAFHKGAKMEDWRQVSARDGEPVFDDAHIGHCFCPNNPRYQKAYLDYIQRHIATVPVDAIISDDAYFPPDVYSCACPHCRGRFSKECAFDLPPAEDRGFWENREDPAFRTWLDARYRWNAEHYQRLRQALPENILLWGTAPTSLSPDLAQIGFSPQRCAAFWDAVSYQASPNNQPDTHASEMNPELVAFHSLARYYQKPFIAFCHVRSADVLPGWLHFLTPHGARPWISRASHHEGSVTEERLLEHGFAFPKTTKSKMGSDSIQAIVFSEKWRDRLEPEEAELYVEQCRQLCNDLIARGSRPFLLFDRMWHSASPGRWECLWTLDPRALDEEKQALAVAWQKEGLAVGVS